MDEQTDRKNTQPKNAPELSKLDKWATFFEFKILLNISAAMLILASFIMMFEGMGRAIVNTSYFWSEEAVRYLLVWAFFLTFGVAGRTGHHIRTDLFLSRLGKSWRRGCDALASLFGLIFSGFMFYASIPQVIRYYKMGMMTESNLDLPMWLVFLAMPIGSAFLFIYYLRCVYLVIKSKDPFSIDADLVSKGM